MSPAVWNGRRLAHHRHSVPPLPFFIFHSICIPRGQYDLIHHIIDTLQYINFFYQKAPANICLKRSSPSVWLPSIMVCWGTAMVRPVSAIIVACCSICVSGCPRIRAQFRRFIRFFFLHIFCECLSIGSQATRLLLGVFEAGFYVGSAFYFSW